MAPARPSLCRSRGDWRPVCVVLLAEAADAADVVQTLLETCKAAIHAVIAFVILRAPRIVLGLRPAGVERNCGDCNSKNRQISHGGLRVVDRQLQSGRFVSAALACLVRGRHRIVGRHVQIVVVAVTSAAGDFVLALRQSREAAIGAGAVGEIRAPRIILRTGLRGNRRDSGNRYRQQQPARQPTTTMKTSSIRNVCQHDASGPAGVQTLRRRAADKDC